MKKISEFLMSFVYVLGAMVIFSSIVAPVSVFAADKTVVSASIDYNSLISKSLSPTIYGFATNTKSVSITVQKEGSSKILYKKSSIRVKNGEWKARISKKLSNGDYEINVYGLEDRKNSIANDTLSIDTKKNNSSAKTTTTFVVEAVPLLFGGTAKVGKEVPVSYIQVINIGKETAILKGFWLSQNGSAPVQSIVGFTTVDDTGSLRASVGSESKPVVFKKDEVFVPAPDVLFTSGQMRLFTIKAIVSSKANSYIGKQLKINVKSMDTTATIKGQFPIIGTTWNIGI